MIQVSRSIVRQFRTIFKKSVGLHCAKGFQPPVVLKTDANGLTIHTQHDGIAVSCHVDEPQPPGQVIVPAKALDEFEGRENSIVQLEATGSSKVLARWTDHGIPSAVEFEATNADKALDLPELPAKFSENNGGLLRALDDAVNSASTDSIRYATNKVQLRGQGGEIVATDGRQLLWQSGFQFPWTDDFLVPRVKVFGCCEFSGDVPAFIGKTDKHVCIRSGQWTVFLPIDKESRFPKVENVVPKLTAAATHVHFDDNDAAFLAKTLPRLPGNESDFSPITLDLNGKVLVRARAQDQERGTQAELSRSQATGQAIRYPVNRTFLARVLALGFSDVHITSADTPALCQEDRRKYIFLGLGKDAALAPKDNDLCLVSDAETPPIPQSQPSTERKIPTMRPTRQFAEPSAPSNGNGQHTNGEQQSENGHKAGTFAALLEEAQTVQNILRDSLLRTNQLLGGLKQYRRQAKAMNTTLASLRQLQEVEA